MNGPDWDGTATRLTAPDSATLPAMSHRRGVPRPPAHIEHEMTEAGRTGNDIRLGLAHAAYEQWLIEQGIYPEHPTGNHAPNEAIR